MSKMLSQPHEEMLDQVRVTNYLGRTFKQTFLSDCSHQVGSTGTEITNLWQKSSKIEVIRSLRLLTVEFSKLFLEHVAPKPN